MRLPIGLALGVALVLERPATAHASPPLGILDSFFALPFPGSNGRACSTCHAPEDHFALLPARVAASDSHSPLFRRIDADDPTAEHPTYDHLHRGLVRIVLPLAANLDVIDANGNVITNAARTIEVWRGVPTIENTALTAPYQYDGRALSYEVQAAGALALHSQVPYRVPESILERIARFESEIFSSPAIEKTAEAVARGTNPPDPTLALHFPTGSDEAAGQAIFEQACSLCHGGARGNTTTSQAAHDETMFLTNADGTPVFGPQGPVLLGSHQDDPFLNIGTSALTYLAQPGNSPAPPGVLPPIFDGFSYVDQFSDLSTLPMPHYRIRFYADASRTNKVVDLPPSPQLGLSPSFVLQQYSTDPGRCIISGDPADYESFKVPQLHGLAKTAPYFHDGSMKSLEDVVEFYSSRVFVFVSAAGLPPINPSLSAGFAPETLSITQKRQLVAFLKQL